MRGGEGHFQKSDRKAKSKGSQQQATKPNLMLLLLKSVSCGALATYYKRSISYDGNHLLQMMMKNVVV